MSKNRHDRYRKINILQNMSRVALREKNNCNNKFESDDWNDLYLHICKQKNNYEES